MRKTADLNDLVEILNRVTQDYRTAHLNDVKSGVGMWARGWHGGAADALTTVAHELQTRFGLTRGCAGQVASSNYPVLSTPDEKA